MRAHANTKKKKKTTQTKKRRTTLYCGRGRGRPAGEIRVMRCGRDWNSVVSLAVGRGRHARARARTRVPRANIVPPARQPQQSLCPRYRTVGRAAERSARRLVATRRRGPWPSAGSDKRWR
jgi:hypothetical protein